ncbi:MAG TPA: cysteine dioxygenase family protein [Vicinamibacterales bacterium]|nr:cysteine dioxygenase family protein [Vicinamibacterales bacterium]
MSLASPELIRHLDRAVEGESVEAITAQVKAALEDLLSRGAVALPDRFREPRGDTYARRLLHRDPGGRYTAIVMTWGPGQGTPVHDHGGLWCVEGVMEGRMAVTQYDVTPEGEQFRVVARDTTLAGVGTAGRLIPPTDYHVMANAQLETPSLTLHVYGGELSQCQIFRPGPAGCHLAETRALAFHE